MSQFRRASEDFKRTWEQEVDLEKIRKSDTPSGGDSNYGNNEPYDPYNRTRTTRKVAKFKITTPNRIRQTRLRRRIMPRPKPRPWALKRQT